MFGIYIECSEIKLNYFAFGNYIEGSEIPLSICSHWSFFGNYIEGSEIILMSLIFMFERKFHLI